VKRILIVRLGALGDIVHAIPVAAALRRAHPHARIDWLVSAKHREILDLVPVVDRRIAVNDRGGGSGLPLLSAVGGLRREHYDVTLDLQGLIKSAMIARATGADRVVGFASRYLREPLARIFYTDIYDPGGDGIYAPTEKRHIVEINLGILEPLGIHAAQAEFPLDRASSAPARQMLEQTGGRYVLLNPGAAWPNKRWPPERLASVAAALNERHHLKSVVVWGPGERKLAEDVAALAAGAALVSPETTIADIVELARGAAVMVSGDTGPTHLAAAVGTPIVGLYGPTRPERNGPWLPDDITLSRASICQCHHLRRCKLDRMCLLDIDASEVLGAVERRLASAERRRA
jgi:heptosyltransferase I